jgi:hypothetical protein
MYHFVTLFDQHYLVQGLTLIGSLARRRVSHHVYVICIDDVTEVLLRKFNLLNVTPIGPSKYMSDDLWKVKSERSLKEFCWTMTPYAVEFILKRYTTLKYVTYIDADLYFISFPNEILDKFERSTKSVLVTEHAYSHGYDRSDTSGVYCVQFLSFKREATSSVLTDWRNECRECCSERVTDGRFGDQMYLNNWPDKFPGLIQVMNHREIAVAPWNQRRFGARRAIFYHFHGYKILNERIVSLGGYSLNNEVFRDVYIPYSKAVEESLRLLDRHHLRGIRQLSYMSFVMTSIAYFLDSLKWVGSSRILPFTLLRK